MISILLKGQGLAPNYNVKNSNIEVYIYIYLKLIKTGRFDFLEPFDLDPLIFFTGFVVEVCPKSGDWDLFLSYCRELCHMQLVDISGVLPVVQTWKFVCSFLVVVHTRSFPSLLLSLRE